LWHIVFELNRWELNDEKALVDFYVFTRNEY